MHPNTHPVGTRVVLIKTGDPDKLDGHVGTIVGFYGDSFHSAHEQFYIVLYDTLTLGTTFAGVWIHGCLKRLNDREAGSSYVVPTQF